MGSLNSFYVMGRVARPAEQVGTRNGQPVVLFGVTTSAQGRAPIALEAAGPQAEQAVRLRRGQGVFVRGLLRVDVVDERPVLVAQVQALDLVVEGGPPGRQPRAPREGGASVEGETPGAPGVEGVPVTGEAGATLGAEGQPDDEGIDPGSEGGAPGVPGAPGDELGARRRPRRRRGRGRRPDGARPEGARVGEGNGEGAPAPAPRPELPPPAPIALPPRPVQPPSDPTYRSDMPF